MVQQVLESWQAMLHTLQAKWAQLGRREQRGIAIAATVVFGALLWGVLLAPAIRVLQKAPLQHQALDAQMDRMLLLQMRARALQNQSPLSSAEAVAALQATVAKLGSGVTARVLGDQMTVRFKQLGAQELAAWLAQPGGAVDIRPTEVHLQRDAGNKPSWSGELIFHLPQGDAAAQ